MKIIKGVLEEELRKALLAQGEYEKALSVLPRGVLVKKYVKGRQYCYLMSREKGKVTFEYKGKLPGKDIKYYDAVKKGPGAIPQSSIGSEEAHCLHQESPSLHRAASSIAS